MRAIATIAALASSAVAAPSDSQVVARPGEESGRVDPGAGDPSTAVLVARAVLFVPRVIVDAAFLPVRGALWTVDRYQLAERFERLFFDDSLTYGLYPIVEVASGFGLDAGARFVHRDLFGRREHASARVQLGGRYRERGIAALRSGQRFGEHVALELTGEFERRPKEKYYGVGNAGPAIESRYRQRLARTTATLDVRAMSDLHLRFAGALTDLAYGHSDHGLPIEDAYDTAMLVGWPGVRETYGELELRWDSRRAASGWEPAALVSTGWLAAAFLGRTHALAGGGDYWRYGADAQHALRLGTGPRVVLTRVHAEAVGAGDVAFAELPELGGAYLLRGYPTDRFRDRVALLGSVAYQWDLVRHASASLFVDAGRVYPALDELTLDGLRVGYGVGVQLHTTRSFLAEASLATSKDGGVFLDLAFAPAFEIPRREVRR